MRCLIAAAAVGVSLALGACGGNSHAGAAGNRVGAQGGTTGLLGARATVDANLIEYRIGLSSVRVPAGKVTLVAANLGRDTHELVVIRTDKPAAVLRTTDHSTRASESGKVAEIDDTRPGAAKDLTLTLRPGHYALICNLPKHYHRGMHIDLTVT